VPADRVVDVQFRSFMPTVRDDQLDLREAQARVGARRGENDARVLRRHPQDKHGSHTYTFADTGLDERAMRERVRRYQEYFDVPSESLG